MRWVPWIRTSSNHDEVYVNGRFVATQVLAELKTCGDNIHSEVRAVLIEGINAYR